MVEAESAEGAALTREHAIVACGELATSIEGALPAIVAGLRAALATSDARYLSFLAERRVAAPLVASVRNLAERLRGESAAISATGRSGERKKLLFASPSLVERMGHPGVELEAHLAQGVTLEDAERLAPRDEERVVIASAAKLPTAALLAALETTLASGGAASIAVPHAALVTALEGALRPLIDRGVVTLSESVPEADRTLGGGALPIAITPFLYDRLELDRIVDLVVGEHVASSVAGSVVVSTSSTWLQREVFREKLARKLELVGVASTPEVVETDSDAPTMIEALFRQESDVLAAIVHPMDLVRLRTDWAARVETTNAYLVALDVPPSVAVDLGALGVARGLRGHQLVDSIERVTIEGPLRRTYWSSRSEGAALQFASDGSLGAALRLCAGAFLP